MNNDLHNYRKSYEKGALLLENTTTHPMDQFTIWFNEVEDEGGITEPNAMTLATLGRDGYVKSRIVLLKEYDHHGFVFYTNYNSEKGDSIAHHNQIGLSFFWPNLERQVIVKGTIAKVESSKSDAYFRSRPDQSKLGALVSDQSSVIKNRKVLEDKMEKLQKNYINKDIPRPDHWGGYLVEPVSMEFWQGRPNRLHDRIRYHKENDLWIKERLAP